MQRPALRTVPNSCRCWHNRHPVIVTILQLQVLPVLVPQPALPVLVPQPALPGDGSPARCNNWCWILNRFFLEVGSSTGSSWCWLLNRFLWCWYPRWSSSGVGFYNRFPPVLALQSVLLVLALQPVLLVLAPQPVLLVLVPQSVLPVSVPQLALLVLALQALLLQVPLLQALLELFQWFPAGPATQ